MNPYTVILRYPEYASDAWPDEICIMLVSALDGDDAILKAQREALAANNDDEGQCDIEDGSDFATVAVFLGHPTQADWG